MIFLRWNSSFFVKKKKKINDLNTNFFAVFTDQDVRRWDQLVGRYTN